jgi:hypothetical protein
MLKPIRIISALILLTTVLSACLNNEPDISAELPATPKPNTSTGSDLEEAPEEKDTAPMVKESAPEVKDTSTWAKTYGSSGQDTINSILPAGDGGYFLLGVANMKWEAEHGADILLIRTDSDGEVIWEKTYPGNPYNVGQSMIFTNEGNILIAAQIATDLESRIDILLMKVDLKGNLLETSIIGGSKDEYPINIQPVKDGGFVLFANLVDPDDFVTDPGAAGYGGFENRSSIMVFRLDESFNPVWTQTFDNGENVMSIGGAQAPDGGFYIVSSILAFPEPFDALYLQKIDQDGNQVWSYRFDQERTNARDFLVTSSGNLLIGALYSQSGDPRDGDADIFLVEFDSQGNRVWSTITGTPGIVDILSGLVETDDGGYLILEDRTANLYNSISDLTLLKLTKDHEIEWEIILDQGAHYMICDLLKVKTGYLAATSIVTFSPEEVRIMLIKTDLHGKLSD